MFLLRDGTIYDRISHSVTQHGTLEIGKVIYVTVDDDSTVNY